MVQHVGLTTEGKAAEERKDLKLEVSLDDEVVAAWKAGKCWQNPLWDLMGALNGLRVFF